MSSEIKVYRRFWSWLLKFLIAVAFTGCSTIKLVGDYDEQIDKGVTQLQKEVESFLVKLEGSVEKPADKVESYEANKKFYEDARVALSGLRVRADSIERNSLTVRMLDRMGNNIARLEKMHREGLSRMEIDQSIRGGLNAQFTAILTFELAKKRGEKIDDNTAASPATPKLPVEGEKK